MANSAKSSRSVVRVARALGKAAALVLMLWAASALAVVGFASRDNAARADAIVVLGAAQYAGRPSPVLKARLDHAIALWKRRQAPHLVVTGGVGRGDTTSEADVARKYAERRGVPKDRILLETHGRTTNESMRAVADILHAREMNSAILVSDRFHMFRLWVLAHRYGLEPHTSPTRTSPFEPHWNKRWRYIFSESVKAPAAFVVP